MANTILVHLLKIESEAAALVSDAHAEADKRISEAEKQNRAAHETDYQNGAAALEAEFKREVGVVRERCQQKLSAFRAKLEATETDTQRFSAVLKSLFAGEM